MREVVFSRDRWLPRVVREDGVLLIEVVGGADALHDPRRFTVPVSEEHAVRIRDDLPRHVLLYSGLLPLCYSAGIRGVLDERAAASLLDQILFGAQGEIDALFTSLTWDKRQLIAHGANVELLDAGEIFAAAQSATASSSWERVQHYEAQRRGR